MKLVTVGTDDNSDLIVQFQVFLKPYSQTTLTLYQIETVIVPIVDEMHMLTHTPKLTWINHTVLSIMKYIFI